MTLAVCPKRRRGGPPEHEAQAHECRRCGLYRRDCVRCGARLQCFAHKSDCCRCKASPEVVVVVVVPEFDPATGEGRHVTCRTCVRAMRTAARAVTVEIPATRCAEGEV